MSILRLPVEIVCRILSLSIRAEYSAFILPDPEFEDGPSTSDCISPDDIAIVCRRWREIVLSDPSLWSTLLLSLRNSTDKTLRRAIKALQHCLERSRTMPLSCFVIFDADQPEQPSYHLALRLLRTLLENQKRWRAIGFRIPYGLRYDLNDALPHFCLHSEELSMLEEINVDGTATFRICGTSQLLSLTSLELDLDNGRDTTDWVLRAPNLEKLSITAIILDVNELDTTRCPITLEKLRYLTLDSPLSALQLLDCPALEELTIKNYEHQSTSLFHNFLSQCPPLRAFRVQNIYGAFDLTIRESLIASSPRNIAFTWMGGSYASSLAFTTALFKALLETRTHTSNAGSGALCLLPNLQGLELVGFSLALASFRELVATRWNAQERRLRSVKLTGCFVRLSPGFHYSITTEPGILPMVCGAVKSFMDEGLRLEIS